MNKEIWILGGLRTPFGSFGGGLKSISAPQLAAPLLSELCLRFELRCNEVHEVILGQVLQGGAGQAPARQAVKYADLPDSVAAMTINKVCGSGLKAVALGAERIALGEADFVLAGGMESMSQAPFVLPHQRWGQSLGHGQARDLLLWDALVDPYSGRHMGELTEDRILERGLSRADQDAYAVQSYQRAQAAQEQGLYAKEILPLRLPGKTGELLFQQDEEPSKVNFAKLPLLKPAFTPNGSITAANASSLNDGAACLLLADPVKARDKGLKPLARIINFSQHSQAASHFSLAPVGAMQKLLAKDQLLTSDIALWEINEAFSAVPLMAMADMNLDPARVNVLGGAVSLGHPVGASGARLALSLALQLHRLGPGSLGVASLCIGGGEAVAMLLEGG